MAWRDPFDKIRARFSPRPDSPRLESSPSRPDPSPSRPEPSPSRPEPSPSRPEPVEGWRDVPSLQRTLAEPLTPVAINSHFRESLATSADPSFVAPLTHAVEPLTGGLVEGLVSPGQPHTHGGPELVIPPRPAAKPAPQVQRRATWSNPELPTVPLEYPVATSSPSSTVAGQPVTETTSSGNSVGGLPPTSFPDPAPVAPSVGSPSVAGQRSADSTSTEPEAEPADAGVDPVAVAEEQPIDELDLVTPEPALADPAAQLDLPVTAAGSAMTSPSSAPRAAATVVQRSTAVASTQTATLGPQLTAAPLIQPAAPISPRVVAAAAEPAVQRISYVAAPTGSTTADRATSSVAVQRSAAPAGPAPTATSASVEPASALPAVQPLRELSALSAPGAPAASSAAAPAAAGTRPSPTVVPLQRQVADPPAVARSESPTAANTDLSLPRFPSRDGKPGSQTSFEATFPSSGRETGEEAVGAPEIVVSRLVDPQLPGADDDILGYTEVPLIVTGNPFRPTEAAEPGSTSIPGPTVQRDAVEPGFATQPDEPLGPAVALESWGAGDPSAAAMPGASIPSFAGPGASFPSVQGESATSTWSSPSAGPAARVAPPIAVRRRGDTTSSTDSGASVQRSAYADPVVGSPASAGGSLTPGSANPVQQAPLTVARRATGSPAADLGPRPGQGMSFASMFSGAETGWATDDSAADAPSVQRAPDDAPTESTASEPAPSEATSSPAPAAPTGAPAAGPAGSATNLDEMARRLYEPLAARLREELWLDRERAGLMSDV